MAQHLSQSSLDKRKYLFGGFPAPQEILVAVVGQHVPDKRSTSTRIALQPGCHPINAVTMPKPVESAADQGDPLQTIEASILACRPIDMRDRRNSVEFGRLAGAQVFRAMDQELQCHSAEQIRQERLLDDGLGSHAANTLTVGEQLLVDPEFTVMAA